MTADDAISAYYDRRERNRRVAWEALQAARERGEPAHVIRELERAHERAANTGD